MLATYIHFYPGLIFVGKAKSLPLEWRPVRGFILVGSSLAKKIRLGRKWMEAATTLAYYDTATINENKKNYSTGANPIKLFTNVIYGFS